MRKITIYQIEQKIVNFEERRFSFPKYIFSDFDKAIKNKFSLSDYVKVYEYSSESDLTDEDLLEEIFYNLNCSQPEDYNGRSLSVSDVVKIDDKLYYCNICGWKDITYILQSLPKNVHTAVCYIKHSDYNIGLTEADIKKYLNSVYYQYPKSFNYKVLDTCYVIITNIEWDMLLK